MTFHHVVHYVFVVGASLIVCWPSSIDDFKSALSDKFLDLILDFLRLSGIPHGKIFHLSISKLGMWILIHLLNNRVKDNIHSSMLLILTSPRVILLNSLKPTYIVMGVRNHMYIKLLVLVYSISHYSLLLWAFILFFFFKSLLNLLSLHLLIITNFDPILLLG